MHTRTVVLVILAPLLGKLFFDLGPALEFLTSCLGAGLEVWIFGIALATIFPVTLSTPRQSIVFTFDLICHVLGSQVECAENNSASDLAK